MDPFPDTGIFPFLHDLGAGKDLAFAMTTHGLRRLYFQFKLIPSGANRVDTKAVR
jgi:hypothetical protein